MELQRVELCSADDHEVVDRLQTVLRQLNVVADDTWHDSPLGVGLTRFRRGNDEVTVFRDAWVVDLVAPPGLVKEILAALSARDY